MNTFTCLFVCLFIHPFIYGCWVPSSECGGVSNGLLSFRKVCSLEKYHAYSICVCVCVHMRICIYYMTREKVPEN